MKKKQKTFPYFCFPIRNKNAHSFPPLPCLFKICKSSRIGDLHFVRRERKRERERERERERNQFCFFFVSFFQVFFFNLFTLFLLYLLPHSPSSLPASPPNSARAIFLAAAFGTTGAAPAGAGGAPRATVEQG